MLNISLQHKMMMKLSPQQVQYLKMLQLPTLALEQKIKAELEMNPLLEEGFEEEQEAAQEPEVVEEAPDGTKEESTADEDSYSIDDFMNDELTGHKVREPYDNEEKEELPLADAVPMYQRLLEQSGLLDLDDEELLTGQEIIGNIDEDGYLRRDLAAIVQDINLTHETQITLEKAEGVLRKIQRLDPVGIGSRSLQECLIVQLEADRADLALLVLTEFYDDFTMRHFEDLCKKLSIATE